MQLKPSSALSNGGLQRRRDCRSRRVLGHMGRRRNCATESVAQFVLGAFVALLTGLSYAEMATAFPHAGAEYVYLRRALPRL